MLLFSSSLISPSLKLTVGERVSSAGSVDLFLLGHMCWAYVIARPCASALKINVNPYLILFLGTLPDIDILLTSFGVQHRTITHSLVFWSIAFLPIFIKYRKRSIPYFVALAQHIILGDFMVGYTQPLWPISSLKLGSGLYLLSVTNMALEITGLVIFLVLLRFNGDSRVVFGVRKHNLLSIAPLIPLVAFLLVAQNIDSSQMSGDESAINLPPKLENRILRSGFLPVIVVSHAILLSSLAISLVQGSRALLYKKAV